MNLKTLHVKRTQSRTEMNWCKREKLTNWGGFTDRQLRSGSECAKAGPDKLEPKKLMRVEFFWKKKIEKKKE